MYAWLIEGYYSNWYYTKYFKWFQTSRDGKTIDQYLISGSQSPTGKLAATTSRFCRIPLVDIRFQLGLEQLHIMR